MKAKRIFCVAGALAFAAMLAGCGSSDGQGSPLNVIDDNNRNWYEIFVRSYCDSGEDGVGDLKGVTMKLDYIRDMGFNGIWLMPICESTTYHGYDVVDYCKVETDYGTNDDFKELVREAHSRGINVIVDTVFNHSSSSHEWFQKAKTALAAREKGESAGENAKYIDYYNFTREKGSGYNAVPGVSGWYYESRFDSVMPDLNLDNAAVRAELKAVMRFWLDDMGCDGFRLDAVTSYYTGNVSKNVEFLKFINDSAKEIKSSAYIVGEAWEGTDSQIREYYESGVDSFFLFTASAGAAGQSTVQQLFSPLLSTPGDKLTNLLLSYQTVYDKGTLAPFLCNHDTTRAANMLVTEERIKMGAGVLALMSGNVFVYYGDEIGMTSVSRGAGQDDDPLKRIPMRWTDKQMSAGQVFVPPKPGVNIGMDAYPHGSVESQEPDENSILNYYKAAMRLRNCHPELARGTVEKLTSPDPYVSAFKKTYQGKSVTVLVNLSDTEAFSVKLSDYGNLKVKDLLSATSKKSEEKKGTLTLQPYSIAILA